MTTTIANIVMNTHTLINADITINIVKEDYLTVINTEDGPADRWVDMFLIVAEHTDGRRWRFDDASYPNLGTAKSILRHLDVGTPSTSDRWFEMEPRYGSDAWGSEDEYNLACFEADCFNEPRPRWF